ncbi:MAG: hypothetical protein A2W90_10690 [Bacteroidetes bacterium GWF2_42_66]|nr:MAG: hypothetical protein A2W92_09680 [Bacteroidetes bacterium GWA2_42_15]OFY01953.1 MAG: hypothetical protein A2W89_23880 [Bacteroidetes bacterium GWE2_42_39]OFY44751.1 MAG: hypothetical protein A2W90_10690 [Bacteroidetes bacterium GWF2_42_66]HBL75874.1 carbon-nitrogen hydrolase family protein [Prolixibacteraceae bacterium]HCU61990.1 carbon-nitrogen hydrolase family protein [Prolixibacteraceae bacterium]
MKERIDQPGWISRMLSCIFLLTCISVSANAANYVTVAVIGNRVPVPDKTQGMQKVVEQVKGFWHKKILQVLPDKPDLIVLPEYCDFPKGISRQEREEYLNVRKNQIQEFFASESKANRCYIAFGMRREMEDGNWRNSCIIVDREGNIAGIYDKKFPTVGDMEGGVKTSDKTPIIQCDFGTIGCAICFDLNFDELRRVYEQKKPDIIVFPSMYHGGLVQNTWAYSCRSFFAGAMAFREIPSEILNPQGEIVASTTNYFDYTVARINLDCRLAHLDGNWEKLTSLKAKYGSAVKITDPGRLGSVLISSEDKNIPVEQMIKEFEIELLDDYFDRSRRYRLEPGNME